jgi:hypothetical protein
VTERASRGQRADEQIVIDTIRSYNSHLSRIEVRTYKDLVDSAEEALNFENESTRSARRSLIPTPQSEEISGNSASSEEDPWAENPRAENPWAENPWAENPWAENLRVENPRAEDPWAKNHYWGESSWAEEPPF